MKCPNCLEETDNVYEHESCNHEVCSKCGEKHLEDCEYLSKQTYPFEEI